MSDGYALGNLFRDYSINHRDRMSTVKIVLCYCIFHDGEFRCMYHDAQLLFEIPYLTKGIAIDCSDRGQVAGLENYYKSSLGEKDGNFLLERTMSYCSASSGWT